MSVAAQGVIRAAFTLDVSRDRALRPRGIPTYLLGERQEANPSPRSMHAAAANPLPTVGAPVHLARRLHGLVESLHRSTAAMK